MSRKPLLKRLRRRYTHSPLEAGMARHYGQQVTKRVPEAATSTISLQYIDAHFYYCVFAEIITTLKDRHAVRAIGYTPNSLRPHASRSLRGFLRTRLFWNSVYDRKWIGLYRAFCDGLGWRAGSLLAPWHEAVFLWRAIKIWRMARTKKALAALTLRGIHVGDLVIDSYLRFKPSPVLVMDDLFLIPVLQQTQRDLERAFRFFSREKPKLHLTSYTTYIQHGIAARVALHLGTRVVAFGNYQDLSKTITPDSVGHARDFSRYAQDFAKLENQAEKLALADSKLRARLDGRIDNAIGYMKNSAYTLKTQDVPDVRGAAVMFLHDFYDSSHVYDWMVFEDLWEWICFTVEYCDKNDIPLFIKPHPNQLAGSESDFSKLQKLYPNLRMVSPDVTNRQLADAGMACAITVRGSVASEMAYMGIPSISAGNNPHVSFDTFFTPRTSEEYAALLDRCRDLPRDKARMKEQACAFYYMHNLNQTEDEVALRDFAAHWNPYIGDDETADTIDFQTVNEAFEKMRANPAYHRFIDDLSRTVAS